MTRLTLAWQRLAWPPEVDLASLRSLSQVLAASAGAPVVIETIATAGQVEHRLGLSPNRAEALSERLRLVVPRLGLTAVADRPNFEGELALSLRLSTPLRLLRVEQSQLIAGATIAALSLPRRGEALLLQWQLLGCIRPTHLSDAASATPSVADVLLGNHRRLSAGDRRALRAKRQLPVWRAVGRLAVHAASEGRRQALLREVLGGLRLAEAPGVHLLARRTPADRVNLRRSIWSAPLRINTDELVALAAWPIGPTRGLPIAGRGITDLAASPVISHRGRIIGTSTLPGRERAIALRTSDALRHTHVIGPTGVGKSTLLLRLIAQDVAAHRPVIVVDPKGDLIEAVLHQIPQQRLDDVVVVEPGTAGHVVGLNPLRAGPGQTDRLADELLVMFRSLYASSWGPRTNDILGASLLTLARTPGMTLCALPALLADHGFRHRVVSRLDDPIGLGSFWSSFEAWSEAERTAAIAPTLSRIRPFLMRPQLRRILGQARPQVEIDRVFSERKVLLVNLAKGSIGTEAAALLGSLVLAQLWSAAQRRVDVPVGHRRPTFVFIDEFQSVLHLPTDLADALAQARGLGIGFVLAHQHLAQLDALTRSAVLANARSRICFQLSQEDARALATDPVSADDFRRLGAFELYAQLVADGSVQPWLSARTLPAPEPISDPATVRARSLELYGRPADEVDREIESMLKVHRPDADDLAPRRRRARGTE